MSFQIPHGDAREILPTYGAESIDSIVTDPPYELGFMGKAWDSTGIAYDVEFWKQCLRVLKPGGHLLAFGGTRTYHRMACAIEDAGFEIRDQIQWLYGSGFPKSLDVSKAIDKMRRRDYVLAAVELGMHIPGNSLHDWTKAEHSPSDQHWIEFKKYLAPEQWEAVERLVVGRANKGRAIFGSCDGEFNLTAPATEQARTWEGWGTALKPANEPICLARKPLEKGLTVAQNVLKWGTGALNIEACRVGTEELSYTSTFKRMIDRNIQEGYRPETMAGSGGEVEKNVQGRFPANVIHDGSDEVLTNFPQSEVSGSAKNGTRSEAQPIGLFGARSQGTLHNDTGSAARFFYCAKASKRDRSENNNHPTVKPTNLMRYLCRLITPPNGIVLDPFAGSGSTGKAAILEGFEFIGIEQNAEYHSIAKERIERASQTLFV